MRDFLNWAHEHRHCHRFLVPAPGRRPGPTITDDQRWTLLARLLHDDNLELTDRVGGALLLLYGQQLSRITALTTQQLRRRGEQVFLRLGRDEFTVPEPLAGLLTALARDRRRYLGVGSPTTTWLFPGLLPGRPLTPARLGERLRALGIYAQPGRRTALTCLAAQLPAAVLADLLDLHPTTAVRWVHDAGGDWNRYAAQLSNPAITNHDECLTPLDPDGGHSTGSNTAGYQFRAGVNPKIVSARLGHATVAFTLDTYTADVPELHHHAAETVSDLFFADDPQEPGEPPRPALTPLRRRAFHSGAPAPTSWRSASVSVHLERHAPTPMGRAGSLIAFWLLSRPASPAGRCGRGLAPAQPPGCPRAGRGGTEVRDDHQQPAR